MLAQGLLKPEEDAAEAAGSGFRPSCSEVKHGSQQQEHACRAHPAVLYGETVAPIIPTGTRLHFVSGEQRGSPRPSPRIIAARDASPCLGGSLRDSRVVRSGGQVTFACCRQIPENRVCSVWAFCGWAQYGRVGRARNAWNRSGWGQFVFCWGTWGFPCQLKMESC